jgi:hypothetical protein
MVAQQTTENHLQGVKQSLISTLNEVAGQPKQSQMARRVSFSPGRGPFSMAGANHVHDAIAGGGNHALYTLEVLVMALEELRHGNAEGCRYLAQGLGTWLEVAIFNPRKVRSGDAGPIA